MSKAKITNRIRRLRFDHDEMTQQQLADRVGCSRQTIILLEQGRMSHRWGSPFRIAKTFGLTVDEVFTYESEGGQASA